MNKRLSIFDLEEGKTYAAFDGDRRLGKRYRMNNGKLENAIDKDDSMALSKYEGCSWVPLKASIGFEEITEVSKTPVSVLGIKQGLVYKANTQINGFVARKGTKLISVTEQGKEIGPVSLATVNLTTQFTAVAVLPKTVKAKTVKRLVAAKKNKKAVKRASARK